MTAGGGWYGSTNRSLRYGARALGRNRTFTTVAVLTLALGIGATTAIFTAVHALLWRPLPFASADQLFTVEAVVPERAGTLPGRIQDYLEWREAQTEFAEVAALQPGNWVVTGTDEPERVGGMRVSANFFAALGVPPVLGRGFLADETRPGSDRVVVISDVLWRRRFARRSDLLGQTLVFDVVPCLIVELRHRL